MTDLTDILKKLQRIDDDAFDRVQEALLRGEPLAVLAIYGETLDTIREEVDKALEKAESDSEPKADASDSDPQDSDPLVTGLASLFDVLSTAATARRTKTDIREDSEQTQKSDPVADLIDQIFKKGSGGIF